MPPHLAGVQKRLLGHEFYSRKKKNKQKKNWACPQPQELPENESLVDSIQIQGVLKPATDLPIFLETSSLI